VPAPRADGGVEQTAERVVFSLNGMAIADVAPRAMAGAVGKALEATGLSGGDVQYVVPHQAGQRIVEFTGMKLEALGVRGELINGMTRHIGNVSSGSIPYALKRHWSRLVGVVACPTAAVGSPGVAEVSQGCVLLKSTAVHERRQRVAA
jgi:3-oxoacyl-[acyl-carrier-protein] synthase III